MAANTVDVFVGSSDHHHRIPSIDGVKALFHVKIAWIGTLHVRSNGVQIRCCRRIDVDTRISTGCNRTVEQSLCTLSTLLFDDFLDRKLPLMGLNRVLIWCGNIRIWSDQGLSMSKYVRICSNKVEHGQNMVK